jgi:two-component sensor histidine kinase
MSENNIKYSNINIHRILLPSEYAVPIALIINELIINAIKHSADQMQRNIIVELTVKENMAILSVMNSCQECSPFPDFEHSTGLGVGLSLVDAILPKDGACLSLTRQQDRVYAQLILEAPVISITDHSHSIGCDSN